MNDLLEWGKLAVDLLKAILSWPVAVVLGGWWLSKKFEKQIAGLISRIKSASLKQIDFHDQQQPVSPALTNDVVINARPANAVAAGGIATVDATLPMLEIDAHAVNHAPQSPVDYAAADPARAKSAIESLQEVVGFERLYNVIWGTQYRLMLDVYGAADKGVQMFDVQQVYQAHREVAGTSARSFDEFLHFLIGSNLIERTPVDGIAGVRVTALGKRFVDYIRMAWPDGPPPRVA